MDSTPPPLTETQGFFREKRKTCATVRRTRGAALNQQSVVFSFSVFPHTYGRTYKLAHAQKHVPTRS